MALNGLIFFFWMRLRYSEHVAFNKETMMHEKQLIEFIEQLPEAEGSFPFGPEALVYKVKGKMFALISQGEDPPYVNLKGKPEDNAFLVDEFKSVRPGYHMNKKHWVSVDFNGDVEDSMIEDLTLASYHLIVSKLTKRDQQALAAHGYVAPTAS